MEMVKLKHWAVKYLAPGLLNDSVPFHMVYDKLQWVVKIFGRCLEWNPTDTWALTSIDHSWPCLTVFVLI